MFIVHYYAPFVTNKTFALYHYTLFTKGNPIFFSLNWSQVSWRLPYTAGQIRSVIGIPDSSLMRSCMVTLHCFMQGKVVLKKNLFLGRILLLKKYLKNLKDLSLKDYFTFLCILVSWVPLAVYSTRAWCVPPICQIANWWWYQGTDIKKWRKPANHYNKGYLLILGFL